MKIGNKNWFVKVSKGIIISLGKLASASIRFIGFSVRVLWFYVSVKLLTQMKFRLIPKITSQDVYDDKEVGIDWLVFRAEIGKTKKL